MEIPARLPPGEAGLGSSRDKADWRTLIPALEKDGVKWAFAKPLTHPDSLADLEASARALDAVR